MNKLIVKFFSNFTHNHHNVNPNKAKISFKGKRDQFDHINKHIITSHPEHEVKHEEVVKKVPKIGHNISPISSHIYRPRITQEEIDIINNGGVSNIKDWNKIKLKKKI
jgi:hypothetical protein